MSKSELRIINDIIEFSKSNQENIFISVNKSNIFDVDALIVGPKNTPYFGGFYFFKLIFPKSYPNHPPHVTFLTTDGFVRFNPNLYADGKVCLSILGTWTGPGWTPVMTLTSVLLSIESLLSENPIVNEPGYDNIKSDNIKAITYYNYILYYNYKISIHDVLNDKFKKLSDKFKQPITNKILKNKEILNNDLLTYKQILDNFPLLQENKIYFMNYKLSHLDFKSIDLI
uniref:Ubiquitin-conjugating enzyme E2 Z n=1 Tax=Megaviridae environmental sample TaxID=1737588 RepID=A0A5J6VJN4_9VIRU|nr:MAG: ubiquitin-conjugating enzyme [Megaviridae environmental sample]